MGKQQELKMRFSRKEKLGWNEAYILKIDDLKMFSNDSLEILQKEKKKTLQEQTSCWLILGSKTLKALINKDKEGLFFSD